MTQSVIHLYLKISNNCQIQLLLSSAKNFKGFPGGSVVKNPPAKAEDMGSIPGLGRSHILQINWAHAPQLLSLCFRAQELHLLKPEHSGACAPQEKPPQWEAPVPQLEKSPHSTEIQHSQKLNKI